MKVLELFAGTRSIGKAFEAKGHEVFSVEWDKKFPDIDLYKDISELTAEEVLDKFGKPDVVWMSPDCFPAGTLVWTNKGYVPIENINCFDDERMKPTDIFTNHPAPAFATPCKNGDPCHVAAPRGSRTGTQGLKNAMERSRIPQKLCEHIVSICEEYFDSQTTAHTPSFYTSRHIVYKPRKLF